ncbi:transposase [Streptomyces chryseus]
MSSREFADWTSVLAGSKHHLITDATGTPLAATLTGGNRNDVTQLIPLLQSRAARAGQTRPARCRPDRSRRCGYDHDKYRLLVRGLGVKALSPRRGAEPEWAPNAGSWNVRSLTCTGSAAYGSAGRYATTSTEP